MAKVETKTGPIKGRMAGTTFFMKNGQQMMMPSHRRVSNPKTEAQMKQRVRMSNILSLYHNIKGFLQDTFEGTIGNKNASSFFRSYNLMQKPVWTTRRNKLYDQCVLAPYVVSNGRFPAIGYTYQDGYFISDLKIGDYEITDSTTLDDITSIIANHNDNWAGGDTLEVILLSQEIPSTLEDIESTELPFPKEVPLTFCNKDGYLAVRAEGEYVFACALIHTRGSKQTLMASPQSLCLSDTTLYDCYTSEIAMAAALKSYKTHGL